MREVQPEVAACNAGSLNYLKTRRDGSWAWPPMLFDNPVPKVEKFLGVMKETGADLSSNVSTLALYARSISSKTPDSHRAP